MPNCLSETISILFFFSFSAESEQPEIPPGALWQVKFFFFFSQRYFPSCGALKIFYERQQFLKEVEKEVSDVVQFRERGDEVLGHYCPNETLTVAREEGDEL